MRKLHFHWIMLKVVLGLLWRGHMRLQLRRNGLFLVITPKGRAYLEDHDAQ